MAGGQAMERVMAGSRTNVLGERGSSPSLGGRYVRPDSVRKILPKGVGAYLENLVYNKMSDGGEGRSETAP